MAAHQVLFNLGITGDVIVLVLEILLTVMLYQMLKPVCKTLALVATFSRLAMSIIMGINLLNYLIPMSLLSGADFLGSFEPDQLESLALVFLNAHQDVVLIWGLFFGVHLLASFQRSQIRKEAGCRAVDRLIAHKATINEKSGLGQAPWISKMVILGVLIFICIFVSSNAEI